jgi:hypothetical protein
MINITHLRIKQLPLTNGHGRYITVTPERELLSVGEWPLHVAVINKFVAVSIPKRFRNGRFTSETACGGFRSETTTWIQKPEVV